MTTDQAHTLDTIADTLAIARDHLTALRNEMLMDCRRTYDLDDQSPRAVLARQQVLWLTREVANVGHAATSVSLLAAFGRKEFPDD
jgi:hypothetical protein